MANTTLKDEILKCEPNRQNISVSYEFSNGRRFYQTSGSGIYSDSSGSESGAITGWDGEVITGWDGESITEWT
jgi:hypothetical protein